MPELFEPTTLNGMKIQNRFVRSATYEAMAESDGKVTEQLCTYMDDLSRGKVGLIITGHAHVIREGQAGPRQVGIYCDEMIDGLKEMTSVVHKNGGLIAVQLGHAGKRGIGKDEYAPLGPVDTFADSVKTASAMTVDDIKRTVVAFGDAAERAVKAHFDAIQIHAAHGYLLSQFLSPHYNKRNDNYSGNLQNRARFLLEVYKEIRLRVGESVPVIVKINSEDFLENGFSVEGTIKVAQMLEEHGIDAIEMSGGTFESEKFTPSRVGTAKSEEREVYYREAAETFKKEITVPLILVGGFLSYNLVEEAVSSGLADYIALCRPLIREPQLISRWEAEDKTKALCISCNKCFSTLAMPESLHCPVEKKRRIQQ